MAIGPVEYIVVGFPGNKFSGEIVPALAELIESGTVRIIDLVFIAKDVDGGVTFIEYDELEDVLGYEGLEGEAGGLLSDEDALEAAAGLEPGSSALMILWEDLWAAPLAHALRNADAVLLGGGRIPYQVVEAAMAALDADS